MNIVLPSNGILGIKAVSLRQPCFSDLRQLENLSLSEREFKIEVVKRLVDGLDPSKITRDDMNYIYIIIASATTFNKLEYSLTCSCGNKIKGVFEITTKDVEFYEGKSVIYKKFGTQKVSFHLLSMKDEMEMVQYSISKEDVEMAYTDAMVAKILGNSELTDKVIEDVSSLDFSLYIAALVFDMCTFHGVDMSCVEKCSKCGKTLHTILDVGKQVLQLSSKDLMARFVGLMKVVDYKSFLDLTIPEYASLVESVNKNFNG